MTTRRKYLIRGVAGLLFLNDPASHAQQPARAVPRIGVLLFTPITNEAQQAFRQGLRDHGYIEGQNILVDWRSAEGQVDRAGAIAAEFVRLRVRVIVAEFTPAVVAAKNATRTIPIVMAPAGDPVASGLVASLARPGGNVTGLSNIAKELAGKRFELLKELLPDITRVGLLIHGSDPLDKAFVAETQSAASSAGIRLHIATVARTDDLGPALNAITKEGVGAVVVPGNLPVPARQIAVSALQHRLPSISLLREFAESGGLMSYGASTVDIRRRAVGYVDKILRGAMPADLPVEQPTILELVINQVTARALGLKVPRSLLLRADRMIE
ncbi:MAG TPA: ABC transporter substrate-binding protein [Burkholderiaceae bacterium]|nr:ABC transporter substrate-binding protein [Burkholderiaceae bacterium]